MQPRRRTSKLYRQPANVAQMADGWSPGLYESHHFALKTVEGNDGGMDCGLEAGISDVETY